MVSANGRCSTDKNSCVYIVDTHIHTETYLVSCSALLSSLERMKIKDSFSEHALFSDKCNSGGQRKMYTRLLVWKVITPDRIK